MGKRTVEELNLLDDFLFQEAISRNEKGVEVCRILLSTILGKTIRKVRVIPQKPILGVDNTKHGIRMDAYIEDVSDDVVDKDALDAEISDIDVVESHRLSDIYDIEPNQKYEKNTLPKRTRYYHALIDSKILETGANYQDMRKVVIIMILPYDPFGKNRMVYTVRNQCLEDTSVEYEDGMTKIFLYTHGTEGKPSQDLREMLQYMEKSTEDNVKNQDIATIHNIISEIKGDREVGVSYMKSWEREEMIREQGIEQGIEQGKESTNKELEMLLTELKNHDKEDCIIRAISDITYRKQLLEQYHIVVTV